MVERRSPKPHVPGSSPGWPAKRFSKAQCDDQHSSGSDRLRGPRPAHGALPRARAAVGVRLLRADPAAHPPALGSRLDLELDHRLGDRRRRRRVPVASAGHARGLAGDRRRASQGHLAVARGDARGHHRRHRRQRHRGRAARALRRALAVRHRQDPEPEHLGMMTMAEAKKVDKKWYVVHTYSGFENKAKKSLEEKIRQEKLGDFFGDILIPMENVVEMVKGEKRASKRKFFPGYILVQMELNDRTWHLVKNTPKITGFVGNATKPPAVSEHEIARLTTQLSEGALKPKPKVEFEEGDSVRVVDGPFSNFNGTVEEVNPDKGRVRVLVSIFGRATPVELDFMQVEKT